VIRPWVDALRPFVPMVVGAVGRIAPDAAAEILTNQLSVEEIDDMIRDIKAPDFAARLNSYYPDELGTIAAMEGGPEWLGQVLAVVLEYDEAEGDAAAPESGTPPASTT